MTTDLDYKQIIGLNLKRLTITYSGKEISISVGITKRHCHSEGAFRD
jgi:hypothetical protein